MGNMIPINRNVFLLFFLNASIFYTYNLPLISARTLVSGFRSPGRTSKVFV